MRLGRGPAPFFCSASHRWLRHQSFCVPPGGWMVWRLLHPRSSDFPRKGCSSTSQLMAPTPVRSPDICAPRDLSPPANTYPQQLFSSLFLSPPQLPWPHALSSQQPLSQDAGTTIPTARCRPATPGNPQHPPPTLSLASWQPWKFGLCNAGCRAEHMQMSGGGQVDKRDRERGRGCQRV